MARRIVFTYSFVIVAAMSFLCAAVSMTADAETIKKRVLYVDSYHEGYPWSTGITDGIMKVLNARKGSRGMLDSSESPVDLSIVRMDTKRNTSDAFKKSAARKVRDVIGSWEPDIVIASDDNASKYLIAPFFKDSSLPFVFCGVNWDASAYGFPSSNVTGMIEISFIPQLIKAMGPYAQGSRVGILGADNLSNRKEARHYRDTFHIDLTKEVFVSTFTEWKKQYLALQKQVDMLIIAPPSFLTTNEEKQEAELFVRNNTSIPTGSVEEWIAPYSLIVYAKVANEQGEWAASTALKILHGASPEDIAVSTNKKAKIYLNTHIARKLDIIFPREILKYATLIK